MGDVMNFSMSPSISHILRWYLLSIEQSFQVFAIPVNLHGSLRHYQL